MPHPEIDRLEPDSGTAANKAAISECVATEVRNGTPQDQAVAMCTDMVRKKTEASNATQRRKPET